jgi:hypothetical protein
VAFRIVDAHEQVLEHLDDESGQTYARETGTNTESFRKIDRALKSALSACVDDYVAAGGDRFNEVTSQTTDAATGLVNLASVGIAHIRSVRVDSGTSLNRIDEGDGNASRRPDLTARELELTVVRRFELPQVPDRDDLLVGTVAGNARSWNAFDEWVCARAAMSIAVKSLEAKRLEALAAVLADRAKSVMQAKRTPSSRPWRERSASWLLSDRLRWLWFPHEQELRLIYGTR